MTAHGFFTTETAVTVNYRIESGEPMCFNYPGHASTVEIERVQWRGKDLENISDRNLDRLAELAEDFQAMVDERFSD